MKTKTTDAVILAAGTGRRYDKNIPKQFIKVTNKSSVEITISKLSKIKGLRNIYLVISKKYIKFIKKIPKKIKIIFGGETRSESVFNSLLYIKNTASLPDNILIHDSVRPCVNNIDIKNLLISSKKSNTGIALGYPLTHALKCVDNKLNIIKHIEKKNFWLSFTPQIFNFNKLYLSYKKIIENKHKVDDDIQAMSFSSHKVSLIFSSNNNIKLTYPDDIAVIRKLMR